MAKKKSRITKERVQLIFDKRKKGYSREDVALIANVCKNQVSMIASAGEALKEGKLSDALRLLKIARVSKITSFELDKISWICEAMGIETPSREELEAALESIKNGDRIAERIITAWNNPKTDNRAIEEYNRKHRTAEENIVEQLDRIGKELERIGDTLESICFRLK